MRVGFNEEQLNIVVDECPQSYEAFRKFYYKTKGMETILGKISQEANPEEVKKSMEMFMKLTLTDNFRDLYDFFDNEGIYAAVLTHVRAEPIGLTATLIQNKKFYNSDEDTVKMMKSMGYSKLGLPDPEFFAVPTKDEGVSDRVRIERYMFLKAFELLEKKLTKLSE